MQNVLEMVVLGESAARKITHLLTYFILTYLLISQTKCGKCANSAIFQMTIFIRFMIIKYETYTKHIHA